MTKFSNLEIKVNREHAKRVLTEVNSNVPHDADWWRSVAKSWAVVFLEITDEEVLFNSSMIDEFQPILKNLWSRNE